MGLTLLEWSLAALGVFLIRHLLSSKHSPLPGPKPLPFIGNIFDVPTDKPWLTFVNWKAKYGDLMSFTIFRRRMVIINSAELSADILDKKSAIYSDRPRLVMAGDLVGYSDSTPFLQYGETFREHRRNFHSLIGSRTLMHKFHPVQESIIHNFLQDVMNNPDSGALDTHIRKMSGAIILKITYGYDVQDGNDPLITLADQALAQFSELVGFGAFLVDILPFLRYVPEWFPGAGFQKTAKAYRANLYEATERPFKYVKDQMAAGVAPVSFISNSLERADLTAQDENIIKWTGLSLYAGGTDTTVSAVYSFFLAMTLYPEVQKKAQAEIDAVVGNNRLPTLADRASLPYVEALSQEIVRWHAIVTSTMIHVAVEDDTHNGYLIPKGSYVSANIWGILHDERTYSEPELFKPERFLGDRPELDPHTVSFGYGRRICPGIHLADASIFISSAMTLAVFSIEKCIENGVEITPKVEPLTGIVSHLTPFKCSIKPRSPEAEALIHETPSM